MKLFGLTGGIGMGKSTSDRLLRERGLPVIDTDIIARQIVEPGQPALAEIQDAFGKQMIAPDGSLRRDELAKLVFSDAAARQTLESISHPRIRKIWGDQVKQLRAEGKALAIVVIPLLFETNSAAEFDATICVACSTSTQHKRLLERGWTQEHLEKRIQAQWPIQKKIDLSNYVVWTEGDLDVHAKQLSRILEIS
jgi:dephospho-CoA kinase